MIKYVRSPVEIIKIVKMLVNQLRLYIQFNDNLGIVA